LFALLPEVELVFSDDIKLTGKKSPRPLRMRAKQQVEGSIQGTLNV
jgi:hypothetical protein